MKRICSLIILLVLCGCASEREVLTVSPVPQGAIGEGIGVQIKPNKIQPEDLNEIVRAGFSYVRLGVAWSQVEKSKGEYDWRKYDELFSEIKKRGLKSVVTLGSSNALYGGMVDAPKNPFGAKKVPAAPKTDAEIDAFAKYAAATVSHYGTEGIIWSIWNEPDMPIFWPPAPDSENYAKLADKTCREIKKYYPDAMLAAPSVAYIPNMKKDGKYTLLAGFLESPAMECVDYLSVHPYRGGNKPPETVENDYSALRKFINKHYKGMKKFIPVIVNEWGYSRTQTTDGQHASYAVRMHLANVINDIPVSIWYEWKDSGRDGKNREHNFGLLYADGNIKPSGKYVTEILPEIRGATIEERLTASGGVYALLLKLPEGQRKILAWSGGKDENFRVKSVVETKAGIVRITATPFPALFDIKDGPK